ncbi:TetR/AcrR family transcriptional regulator [Galactobacter caseinivorans]|uniref:TetR/AcrR family transcriptional regulator n=1 Tax=Galactobacter caseinivorans TaxID=2676123 RepID=A0A496PHN6_9MICC|nr:TetR/AcrR family transcriptional regulator [Galactobacter caseinivorans]RKW70006.1 TetR/AcrR family transcriptional regulator [Galactobacter caseinivorans]
METSGVETDPGREMGAPERKRLSRAERGEQMLHHAREILRHQGSDALTLARVAETAGVTKPIAYDHFGTRGGLLLRLYEQYEEEQCSVLERFIAQHQPHGAGAGHEAARLAAGQLAQSYISCALTQGRELPGVAAALDGDPNLRERRREIDARYTELVVALLGPHTPSGAMDPSLLEGILGAARAVSDGAVSGRVSEAEATAALTTLVAGSLGVGVR